MRFLKLFITVFAMAIAMNVSAQSKTTAKAKTTTTTTTTKAKSTTTAPAKKATAAKSTATTTAKSTATTTTASKPAATSTKTATASASKPAKKASTSFATKDYDPGYHMMLETKFGSFYGTGGFGANVALEHEFHKYLAWDLFSVDFSAPFNFNVVSVGLKTGIRAFSPYWWNGKMRAFSSLAVGYDCGITVDSDLKDMNDWAGVSNTSHGFALSWGAGVQIIDHLFVGYTLEYSTAFKSTSHYGKIAWRF